MHHDITAEQAIIGAVLMNNEVFGAAAALKPEDFYEPIHAELWDHASKVIGLGKRWSPATARQFLPADIKIGEMTGAQYLARLAAEGAAPVEISGLVAMLRDMSDRRQMASIGAQMEKSSGDPAELAAWAIEQLDEISTARTPAGFRAVSM
jgi:replicative DNA helicase